MGSHGVDPVGSNNNINNHGVGNLNSSSRMMFDQKEPYIEINFKHGLSLQNTMKREPSED